MQLKEFQQKVSEMLSEVEFEDSDQVTILASYLAAASSSVVTQINDVHNEITGFPVDDNYDEHMANLDTLTFALGVDVVDLNEERLRASLLALQCRLSRKALLGNVDQIQVFDCMLGMLTGYVAGVLIASRSDDLENTERWQAVGNMLRKDLFDRIMAEVGKHNPDVGQLN
jgi:hypothetical protein